MTHFRPQPPQEVARPLKQAGLILLLFLCVFIPFRQPLADLTFSGVKAVPDVLILCLAAWYVVSVRFRLRFQWNDLLFLAFEGTALGITSTGELRVQTDDGSGVREIGTGEVSVRGVMGYV